MTRDFYLTYLEPLWSNSFSFKGRFHSRHGWIVDTIYVCGCLKWWRWSWLLTFIWVTSMLCVHNVNIVELRTPQFYAIRIYLPLKRNCHLSVNFLIKHQDLFCFWCFVIEIFEKSYTYVRTILCVDLRSVINSLSSNYVLICILFEQCYTNDDE